MADTKSEKVKLEAIQLMKTTQSWDGTRYTKYPDGQPEISIIRYRIPAHTTLPWHSHPVINAAYVISGYLTVVTKNGHKTIMIGPGDVLPETVDLIHTGQTDSTAVELIVFYAGTPVIPLTVRPDLK